MSGLAPARAALLGAGRLGRRQVAACEAVSPFVRSGPQHARGYAAPPKPSATANKASPAPPKTTAAPAKSASAASKSKPSFGVISADELHELPPSVKNAAKPSGSGEKERYDEQGNSLSPADISSRPAEPGPSAPPTEAQTAAPSLGTGSASSGGTGSRNMSTSSTSSPLDSNWGSSFAGMSTQPFPREAAQILEAPINEDDVEIKPDGLIYLPEIKYRRILNRAFGPGGWGLAPRSETNVGDKIVSREWALICLGRFVSTARGEQEYFDANGVATASEGAKSNALMRCCKDLGIAHELWSPRFIRDFKQRKCIEIFCDNASTGRKRKLWRRKDAPPFEYPWKESK